MRDIYSIDITDLVEKQMRSYLVTTHSLNVLRDLIVTPEPIRDLKTDIEDILNELYKTKLEKEKLRIERKFISCQHEEDLQVTMADNAQELHYHNLQRELEGKLIDLRHQLQFKINRQEPGAVNHHHTENHFSREQLESEITRVGRSLTSLKIYLYEIKTRESDRRTRNSSSGIENRLTRANFALYRKELQTCSENLAKVHEDKRKEAVDQIYPTFLRQLKNKINQNASPTIEEQKLLIIIEKMNQYLQAKEELNIAEKKLSNNKNKIIQLEKTLTQSIVDADKINRILLDIPNKIHLLEGKLDGFDRFNKIINRPIIVTSLLTTVLSVVAGGIYALAMSKILTAAILPTIAIGLGIAAGAGLAVTIGLLATKGINRLMAWSKRSSISSTREHHKQKMDELEQLNRVTIPEASQSLANARSEEVRLTEDVSFQQTVCTSLLKEAQQIDLSAPFYPPSAPPAPAGSYYGDSSYNPTLFSSSSEPSAPPYYHGEEPQFSHRT